MQFTAHLKTRLVSANLCFSYLLLALIFIGCSMQPGSNLDLEPTRFAPYMQEDFSDYVAENQQWIAKNRVFRSDDKALEVEVNTPFERKPSLPNKKGVLLIHGLSDSPYSFIDVADRLVEKGYLVRTLLLPGHGAKPADLMLPALKDWLALVAHHTALMQHEVEDVWLGGFSTGANLALIEAYDNEGVAGVLLFSPGIDSSKPLDFLAPYAKHLIDWTDIDPEMTITRFDSLTMNAAALYYETAKLVRERIAENIFTRPVLFTLSESDSVIDSQSTYQYFIERFKHADNRLVWFGEQEFNEDSIVSYSMDLPEQRISTGSHMSVLYAPENAFYGEQGSYRICNNGQSEKLEAACNNGAETWFGSFDYKEADRIYARLTWNPYFAQTMETVFQVLAD